MLQPKDQKESRNVDRVEARVDSIMSYCVYSIEKTRFVGKALVHLSVLVVVFLIVLLPKRHSETYIFEQSRIMHKDAAETVITSMDAIDWFDGVLVSLFELRAANHSSLFDKTMPLAMCRLRLMIDRGTTLRSKCDGMSQLRILPVDEYDALLDALCDAKAYNAQVFDYYFTSGESNETALEALRESRWHNPDTKMVATFLLYSSGIDQFILVDATFEPHKEGLALWAIGFTIPSTKSFNDVTIITLESLLILFCFYTVFDIVRSVMLNYELMQDFSSSISFGAVYDSGLCIFIAVYVVQSFIKLRDSLNAPDVSSDVELFTYLEEFGRVAWTRNVVFAWVNLAIVLRTLLILRHWSRLSQVTETILSSIPSLVGAAIVFFAVITMFAITGNVLYGSTFYEFRSIGSSLTFLMILIFREGSLEYKKYIDAAPISGPAFFILFAFLSQIIILNIVVGIIASSFSAAASTMELVRQPNWGLVALATDTRNFFRRFRVLVAEEGSEKSSMELQFVQDRLDIFRELQKQNDKDRMISAEELSCMLRHIDMATCAGIVTKAKHHIGTSDAVSRQSKSARQAMKRTERMDVQLWKQIKMIHELHAVFVGSDKPATQQEQVMGKSSESHIQMCLADVNEGLAMISRREQAISARMSDIEASLRMLEATAEAFVSHIDDTSPKSSRL